MLLVRDVRAGRGAASILAPWDNLREVVWESDTLVVAMPDERRRQAAAKRLVVAGQPDKLEVSGDRRSAESDDMDTQTEWFR